MCSQTPNQAQEWATHTNRRNGGGNAILTIAPVGTSKHQSGHVEEFPTPHAPICAHLQGDLLMQQKVWLRAEQKKGGDVCQRQSTPHLHHSMRSATNVARRALVASISTPYGEDKSTQCAIFHAEVAPREIKPQHIIWPRKRGENSHAAQLAKWRQPKDDVLTSNLQIVFPCATW
jgi:hypothetical protein